MIEMYTKVNAFQGLADRVVLPSRSLVECYTTNKGPAELKSHGFILDPHLVLFRRYVVNCYIKTHGTSSTGIQ